MPVEFKIILPAKLEYFQAFQSSISNYARQQGISQARISEIELAVEQALVNVFHYAYKETNGEVEVVCRSIRKSG
jgi:anti-sigma regulatory factor (Ser/Thr protein kinase)